MTKELSEVEYLVSKLPARVTHKACAFSLQRNCEHNKKLRSEVAEFLTKLVRPKTSMSKMDLIRTYCTGLTFQALLKAREVDGDPSRLAHAIFSKFDKTNVTVNDFSKAVQEDIKEGGSNYV